MRYIQSFLIACFMLLSCMAKGETEPMVVGLHSGLGNQMFQLAAQVAYAYRFGREICLSKEFNSAFSIPYRVCTKDEIEQAKKKSCYYEPFREEVLTNNNCSSLTLYLQDERFFRDQSDLIRRIFAFSSPLPEKAEEIAEEMAHENSVAVHVRRRDYISHHYPMPTHSYYEKAADYIQEKTESPIHLYVFSDDTDWVQQHFFSKYPITIVSGNKDVIDMQLMTRCKHYIISNSSFSWWGAWLNPNPDKIVIAPKPWHYSYAWWGGNIVLPDWKVMPAHDVPGGYIAVISVAIGPYIQYWDTFYNHMEKYFVPELPKTYYVVTDDTTKKFPKNVVRIPIEDKMRNGTGLKQYHMIHSIRDKLKKYDYVYFLPTIMRPKNYIYGTVIPNNKHSLVFWSHPVYYGRKDKHNFPYERNPKSTAYIPETEGQDYVIGGFIGGMRDPFLKMAETLMNNVNTDEKNGIQAQWNDESYLNRYLVDYSKKQTPIILSPSYGMPEEISERWTNGNRYLYRRFLKSTYYH